jgi:hypothetical protein
MERTRRHTKSFPATDSKGRPHAIHVYTEFIRSQTFGRRPEGTEGLNELVTDQGQHVDWLKKGEYQVVEKGEILTSTAAEGI